MLSIRVYGKDMPALVFFHGWGFDKTIWYSLIPKLSSDYSLYLVDLPGFGDSSLMSWQSFKSELLAILPTKFSVIGWSMGGLFATRLALEEEGRFYKLVNVASTPYFIKSNTWPGIESQTLESFYLQFQSNPSATQKSFIQSQVAGSLHDFSTFKFSKKGLKTGLEILRDWDLRPNLSKLEIPVLYMFGQLDSIVPRATAKSLAAIYPQFKILLFKKAGHLPFLSVNEIFIEELQIFLRSQP